MLLSVCFACLVLFLRQLKLVKRSFKLSKQTELTVMRCHPPAINNFPALFTSIILVPCCRLFRQNIKQNFNWIKNRASQKKHIYAQKHRQVWFLRPLGQKEFFSIVQNENLWNTNRLVWKHLSGTFKIQLHSVHATAPHL